MLYRLIRPTLIAYFEWRMKTLSLKLESVESRYFKFINWDVSLTNPEAVNKLFLKRQSIGRKLDKVTKRLYNL